MSVTRTQVYLTEQQRKHIDALARAKGVTMAEIIRRAFDVYLDREIPDPDRALAATFGGGTCRPDPTRERHQSSRSAHRRRCDRA